MSLSVIIPSRNAVNLRASYCPIQDSGAERLFVIDDGLPPSIRGDCALHETLWHRIYTTFIPGVQPFIFARNVNLGIQAAGADDVILLNDDALLETPGGFAAMQREAQEHPEYGVIAASTNLAAQVQHRQRGERLRDAGGLSVAFVCVLIPRRTFELVGLLDERFGGTDQHGRQIYGWEDDDYCRRVRNAGLKVGVYDGCYVDHGSLTSTFRGDPRAPGDIAAGRRIYEQKWGCLA